MRRGALSRLVHDGLRGGPFAAQDALAKLGQRIDARDRRRRSPKGSVAREPVISRFVRMPRADWPVAVEYPAPDMWITLPDVAQINAGQTSIGYRLEFAFGAGTVLGWKGCAVGISDQTLAASSLGVRLSWNGQEELVSNGQAAAFLLFHNVFSAAYPYAPLNVQVSRKDTVTVYFQNRHTANNYTPELSFAFLRAKSDI